MSKLYEKYLKKKLIDKNKIYLFRNGVFYTSLCEDAKFLSERFGFKLTSLNPDVLKCGFPVASIPKYEDMLKLDNISYEIVNDSDKDLIIKMLEKVNIDNCTPVEALNILKKLCDLL